MSQTTRTTGVPVPCESVTRNDNDSQVAKIAAATDTARFFGSLGTAFSMLFRKEAVALGLSAVGIAAFSEKAQANLRPDGSDDALYKAKGSQLQGQLLSFRVLVPGIGTGQRDTSATYFNSEYALTTAHNVVDLLQFNPSYEVATGDNYLTNRGMVIPVASVTVYPGYDGTRNTPDLAIIHFAQPQSDMHFAQASAAAAMAIGRASPGDILTSGGFGVVATPSGGTISPRDGFSRAWESRVDSLPPTIASSVYYWSSDFGFYNQGILNGKGMSGDSGGPEFNSLNELVGIDIAQVGNTGPFGAEVYLNLSQSEISSWINANTTVVPKPSSLLLVGLGAGGLLLRRRHAV
jgi:hypothetical protein